MASVVFFPFVIIMGIIPVNCFENISTSTPTMEPTYSPTYSPTNSPTRFPTIDIPFISYISVDIRLANTTEILLIDIYNNIDEYIPSINVAIEKSLLSSLKDKYSDDPVNYNDFEVDIVKLNDIEINDDSLTDYIPSNDTFYLTTQIACNRDDESLVCRLILSILQTHTETFLNIANNQIRITLQDNYLYFSINQDELNNLIIQNFETKRAFPSILTILLLIVTVCMLIFCWVLYGNNMCKRCCGKSPAHDTRRQNLNNNIVYNGVNTRSDVSSNIDSNYADEQKGFL